MMQHDHTNSNAHTPECYLGDEMLLAYLQGNLEQAEALLVATQYHMCPTTRERLKTLNECAAATLEEAEPKKMKCCPYKFFEEKCLKEKAKTETTKEECVTGSVPKPLRSYIGDCFTRIKWSAVMPGIRQKRLKTCGKASAKLMKIDAGVQVPEHTHAGSEYTLVLEGSFKDGDMRYTPGMVSTHTADEHKPHAPIADQECICLLVLTAPISLLGLWGKVLNPFLRWKY